MISDEFHQTPQLAWSQRAYRVT